MIVLTLFLVFCGLVLLFGGGELLTRGAVSLAQALGMSQLLIGLTVVAAATSMPELVVALAAALENAPDIAIGNVIGSNIFNLGLVLGTAALLSPLQLSSDTVATQVVPAMIFCLALIPLAYTGKKVNRWEGALLLVGYAAFLYRVL